MFSLDRGRTGRRPAAAATAAEGVVTAQCLVGACNQFSDGFIGVELQRWTLPHGCRLTTVRQRAEPSFRGKVIDGAGRRQWPLQT